MDKKIAVARCHEIQLAIRDKEIPRFESIPEVGMAVQLAMHIRGLPPIDYAQAKLVAATVLGIPRLAFDRILGILAQIEFVRLSGGHTRTIVPTVPFFDDLYEGIGDYLANEAKPDEFESLTLEIVDRLAAAPHNVDSLAGKLGADRKAFDSSVDIATQGSFLIARRARSKTVLLNPAYFSENADLFADHVARSGAGSVQRTLGLLQAAQGWPLSLIAKSNELAGHKLQADDVLLLQRLAQDGAVKPPSIVTSHAGESVFLFTPTPNAAKVSPLKREQYERAMAIVSAVRQGQLLPNRFRIRSPGAVLYKLKTELQLAPTSDYAEQYQNLVQYRVARLEQLANGYRQLKIIDTPENREALEIAYRLVQGSAPPDLAVDKEAMNAMTGSQEYVESLVSAKLMRERQTITLPDETRHELSQLLLEF